MPFRSKLRADQQAGLPSEEHPLHLPALLSSAVVPVALGILKGVKRLFTRQRLFIMTRLVQAMSLLLKTLVRSLLIGVIQVTHQFLTVVMLSSVTRRVKAAGRLLTALLTLLMQ